ncbi:5'-3' exoribonuclease 1 isoform X1 [Hydra vulgaris]|uniref:5'-3' exoribonuclease 1 isoform X1 n=1 Tax=Hydra vulgaris TaxID=6087 RepID=UPI001F5F6735|nr:5'-3' exoribonuclease 1 isoform X2 [Hydra vulgaris]
MGVPKFYRWLSERYPCLSQIIKENQIPEFDNLYLDMNGIIHPCSHPNDDDPHFRITEAQIFKNIFNYIEVLFRIIKPKQNFFMAVDGCAPRAKMNQQRSRRFRTAKEAEEAIRKAIQKGQTLPPDDRFDSNCITPGTEFMWRLQHQLKYFVNQKISSDPLWQECTIYLSGHDVPGEGEHKVMDFIRYCKSKPDYDPNTRHCLYGLDADLIMLGLSTHEPHFSLLREEIRYGKQSKRLLRPDEQTFHLLHLSLLREYLEMEFIIVKDLLHFRFDTERIIDDWIFLGFLVGNDFVPHLPHMHINHDALPYIFKIYKEFLPTTDGYLNDGGMINLCRLKKFFEFLSKFDRERFHEVYADLKWLESKGSGKLLENSAGKKKFADVMRELALEELNEDLEEIRKSKLFDSQYSINANISGAFDELSLNLTPEKPGKLKTLNDDIEVEDDETFELEFQQHKRHYYMEKFDMDIADNEHIQTICTEYVIALQWISHYYFNGLQSWSWYYPYHYSPYISDVANFELKEINFEMGHPFLPFEQLLAVLPAASRKLLPEAYQSLMIMDNSPIIDFYPPDFRTDLNGKQQDWEGVVLIPFIDETRLLKAVRENCSRLTEEEKQRNSFGCSYKYNYDKALNFVYPSCHPDFDDITSCKAKVEIVHKDLHRLQINQIKKGLMKDIKLDIYLQGFPTMKHLKFESYLEKAGVKVFQYSSRSENTIIKILSPSNQNIEDIAKQLLGEIAYVEWPYMVEANIVSVTNDSVKYFLGDNNEIASKLVQGEEYKNIKKEMKAIATYHMEKRGIQLGDIKILVQAKLLLGERYNCSQKGAVQLEKEWSSQIEFYPLQTVVQNLLVHNQKRDVLDSVPKLFPTNSLCFMMSFPFYGCCGEVVEIEKETGRVRVALNVLEEPDFSCIIDIYDSLTTQYVSDRTVSQRLGLPTHLLSRITGNVFINMSNNTDSSSLINVGLKLKYTGQNKELLGYARRSGQGWTYSPAALTVIKKYMNEFPELFEALGKTNGVENCKFNELLPGQSRKYMDKVQAFLKSQLCFNNELVQCGSSSLDEPVVKKIEEIVDLYKLKNESKIVKVKVKPQALFRPTQFFGKLAPDPSTEFLLMDRVVNVQNGITVPLGLRGTVIGLQEDENNKNSKELKIEILFDECFLGAVERRSKEKRVYILCPNSLLNISYGERKNSKKNGTPLGLSTIFQNKISSTNSNNQSPLKDSPRQTPGIIRTPTQNYSSPSPRYKYHNDGFHNRNYHSQNSGGQLISPDYWLKGYTRNSTPQQNTYRQSSPYTKQHRYRTPNSAESVPKNVSHDSNDFMNMWQELRRAEQQKDKNQQPYVDQNATAAVHQLLHIPLKNKSPVAQVFNKTPTGPSYPCLNQQFTPFTPPHPFMPFTPPQSHTPFRHVFNPCTDSNLSVFTNSQAKSTPVLNLNEKISEKSLFVPHQVLVKTTTPQVNSSEVVENQIKDILGIKTKSSDEQIKDLLGIKKAPTSKSDDSDQIKKLLGINSECKTKTDSSSALSSPPCLDVSVESNTTVLSTNVESNTNVLLGNVESNTTVLSGNDQTAIQKKKILLAPSFFGPKKK